MDMNQKGFANIVLILIVIAVVAGGVGYFVLVKKSLPVVQQITTQFSSTTQTSATQPQPSTPKNETADWKVYRNEKYGFEIKFNPDWKITYYKNSYLLLPKGSGTEIVMERNANEISILDKGCNCNIRVEESPQILLEDWIKQVEAPSNMSSVVSKNKMKIGGQAAYDITSELPGFYRRTIFFVKDLAQGGSLKFTISLDYKDKIISIPEFDSMLSTLTFKLTAVNENKDVGKFTFPAGGENFAIGKSQKATWQMPGGENIYYTLAIDLINEQGEKLGNIINWNWVKYNPIDSVNWDFKTVYNSVPSGKTPEGQTVYELKPDENVKIQPGNYKLRLHYDYSSHGGTKGSFDSNYFKIVN